MVDEAVTSGRVYQGGSECALGSQARDQVTQGAAQKHGQTSGDGLHCAPGAQRKPHKAAVFHAHGCIQRANSEQAATKTDAQRT